MQPAPEITPLHLFEGYGVELEYMIVDRETLNVRSLADKILEAVGDEWTREVECGPLAWSNELVLHVVELKTNGPASSLDALHEPFEQDIRRINDILMPHGACLLPTAMHPWIQPDDEATLWQHEDVEIYNALDRIFGCQGHGWKNLQSAHLNLPFYDDAEFVRLHAAIRLVLPLIPALAAASPYMDGVGNNTLDNRLMVYQGHCRRFPQAMGPVIPEAVNRIEQYHTDILQPIYDALKPFDPDGILAYEWINARGAIARFDRQAIEIRLTDVQECPLADIAIVQAVAGVIQWLTGQAAMLEKGNQLSSEQLKVILQRTIHHAQDALIEDGDYLRLMGINTPAATGREVWKHLLDHVGNFPTPQQRAIETILDRGALAFRMKQTVADSKDGLAGLYHQLKDCLAQGKMLLP